MREKGIYFYFVVIAMMFVLANIASADIPQLINYQAKLVNSSGTPLNDTYNITFLIYDSSTSGTELWSETHSAIAIKKGNLNVLLGSVKTIPETLFDSPSRFLGIKIGDNSEMSPRQQIVSTAYSFRAHSAQNWKPGGLSYQYTCEDTPTTITEGIIYTSQILVSDAPEIISSITVDLDLNPIGQLKYVTLKSPKGTEVDLVGKRYLIPVEGNFDKTLYPFTGSMNDFLGEDVNGKWELTIETGPGPSNDTIFNKWQININETSCSSCSILESDQVKTGNIKAKGLTMTTYAGEQSVFLNGGDGTLVLGGAANAEGSLRIQNALGENILETYSNGAVIGGTGNAANLWLRNSSNLSTIIMYGSDGSADINGTLYAKNKIKMAEIANPATPPSGQIYLFARDNAGKTQLCV